MSSQTTVSARTTVNWRPQETWPAGPEIRNGNVGRFIKPGDRSDVLRVWLNFRSVKQMAR